MITGRNNWTHPAEADRHDARKFGKGGRIIDGEFKSWGWWIWGTVNALAWLSVIGFLIWVF